MKKEMRPEADPSSHTRPHRQAAYFIYGFHEAGHGRHWERLHQATQLRHALARARVLLRRGGFSRIEIHKHSLDPRRNIYRDQCVRVLRAKTIRAR
jgi:hypothetical protein